VQDSKVLTSQRAVLLLFNLLDAFSHHLQTAYRFCSDYVFVFIIAPRSCNMHVGQHKRKGDHEAAYASSEGASDNDDEVGLFEQAQGAHQHGQQGTVEQHKHLDIFKCKPAGYVTYKEQLGECYYRPSIVINNCNFK
jgi:hypothetical protein